jgi:hypothetical protein
MNLTIGDQRAVVSHYSIGCGSMQLPVTTLPRPYERAPPWTMRRNYPYRDER